MSRGQDIMAVRDGSFDLLVVVALARFALRLREQAAACRALEQDVKCFDLLFDAAHEAVVGLEHVREKHAADWEMIWDQVVADSREHFGKILHP